MVYADYQFYALRYGGTLDELTFLRLAERASLFADAITGYRLGRSWPRLRESIRLAVMTAVCAYVEQANIEEHGGPIAQETNDGISRTYAQSGQAAGQAGSQYGASAQGRFAEAIRVYLAPTGLLYRGRGR